LALSILNHPCGIEAGDAAAKHHREAAGGRGASAAWRAILAEA
jgi:hypothetical protein